MSIPGNEFRGKLDELHATGCDGTEYSACRAVPNMRLAVDPDPEAPKFFVLHMVWCGECGAADYEVV